MKALPILTLAIILTIGSLYGEPATFEEFKQLPRAEQDALFNDHNHSPTPTLLRWRQRLGMSDLAWQYTQEEQLCRQKGFGDLPSFIIDYQHLVEAFLRRDYARKQADGMSSAEKQIALAHYREVAKSVYTIYEDNLPLLAALVPTKEALSLNEESHAIDVRWQKRWPVGTKWTILRKDMATVDQQAQTILNQLRKLPQMTPEQVKAAMDALPPANQ